MSPFLCRFRESGQRNEDKAMAFKQRLEVAYFITYAENAPGAEPPFSRQVNGNQRGRWILALILLSQTDFDPASIAEIRLNCSGL